MQHLAAGLGLDEVVESAIAGCERAARDTGVRWGLILDAIRTERDSLDVAELAARYAGEGVVGFDLAGREQGSPPDEHLAAIRRAREFGLGVTIHAGEAGGVASIASAVNRCGADRIGHGIDIIEDCRISGGRITDLGPVASVVHARSIPLEICPISNLQTKGWSIEDHPVAMLDEAGFVVTISPDNRLMSATTLEREYSLLSEAFGFGPEDFRRFNRNAARAAFIREDRGAILDAVGSA
jgi:adenosine deaminase